jgi:hypothetical protein
VTAIEVLEVKPITGHGYLRAFAKVLGTVHPRLSSDPAARTAAVGRAAPGSSPPKADGSGAGWFPVIEITRKELLDWVRAAVLDAWGRAA